jgi:cellulose synthase/poly-beta-1,6-N-acetylglucosamine synthase-like glycosyltransferase/tetratricopeptide (TPR) repeat protein
MSMRTLRRPAMLLAVVLAMVYLTVRVTYTLNLSSPYAVFASFLLLIGEAYGIFTMSLYFLQVWDVSEPPRQPVLPDRTVDVFVPTYNEDRQLLRATLQACVRMDYPHRTFLLDDGKRPDIKALAEELGVGYITRSDNKHAKAGNLNNALKQTDGEFIIILDADHVPEKHFITRLIGYFSDEKLAFVQTPHAFYNFDSFQASHNVNKKTYWEEGDMFYGLIQLGKNRFHCPIFAGSAAMFRRVALEEIGGIATETITEDMHTGMRINARGWKSLAITERLIAGQAAPDVTTFHSQRLRWAKGNLSIMWVDNPLTMRGLTFGQRICHFACCIHWMGGLFRLPLYLTPLLFLYTGVAPVVQLSWPVLTLTALYLLVTWTAVWVASRGRFSFWNSELFDMMSFWTKSRGALQALLQGTGGKFVVTSKRGRQTKSVWPLVRPHMVLVVVTLLALLWGWAQFAMGLSDDWRKLSLATLWATFYLSLAFVVIRRALAPDDCRYDYRHPVNLGLTYEIESDKLPSSTPRLGLTVDVSESGLGVLTYEPLQPNTVLRIELDGAGESLHCHGRVAWTKELYRTEGMCFQGYRNGLALENLTPVQLDVLQHIGSHYAVSKQYQEIALGNSHTGLAEAIGGQAPALARGLEGQLYEFHLPLMLKIGDGADDIAYGSTEVVAQSGLKVLLPMSLPIDTHAQFVLGTPLGNIRGKAKVVRYDMLQLGGTVYYLCALTFIEFVEHDRDILHSLVDSSEHRGPLMSVLRPHRQKKRLPLLKPAAIAASLLLPLMAIEASAFFWLERDDIRLSRIAVKTSLLTDADIEHVRHSHEEILAQNRPSTDRLVLLRRAWKRVNDDKHVDQLTEMLAARDPDNLDLQIALFDSHVKNRKIDIAKTDYARITRILEYRFMSRVRQSNLLLAIARACVHDGDYRGAASYFALVLQMVPEDRTVRLEYAGVLLQDDRPKALLALYGGEARSASERFLIATAYRRLGDQASAESECRKALNKNPDNVPVRLLLADTLRAAGQVEESNAIFAEVSEVDPENETLRMRLAFDAVGGSNHARALELFRPLLTKNNKRADLARSFVDAAAGMEKLKKEDRALITRIYEQVDRNDRRNRVFLDRLAWVLQTMGDYERSASLLQLLVSEDPTNRQKRLRLAICLTALERQPEAVKVLAALGSDPEAKRYVAGLSLKKGDTETAVKTCREALATSPRDVETLNLLAISLAARKDYQAAEEVYGEIVRLQPNESRPRERLAELSLWAQNYPLAVTRYQKLLKENPEQTDLWPGYVNAAAGCKVPLTEDQKEFAILLGMAVKEAKHAEPMTITRLSYVLIQVQAPLELVRSLLQMALKEMPEDPPARKELAGVLAAAKLPKESLALYEGLPLSFEEERQLVNIHVAAGDLEEAVRRMDTLSAKRPNDPDLRMQLADVLTWCKRYDDAARVYLELLKADPDNGRLQSSLAQIHLAAGQYDLALSYYRKALNANQDLISCYTGYIDAAASAGSFDGGADRALVTRIVDWARREHPADLQLLKRVTWVCQRAKDRETAVALLKMTGKLDPRDIRLILELADTYYEMGLYSEAETNYLRAAHRDWIP